MLSLFLTIFSVLVITGEHTDPETVDHLRGLSSAAGIEMEIVCKDASGLDRETLKSGWDAVVLDSQCVKPSIMKAVRKMRGARAFMIQDWAFGMDYRGEVCVDPRFADYGFDQKRMYAALAENSRAVSAEYGIGLIPVGTAVQNVRATFERDNLTRDGVHLNYSIGCYLAACTWFEALTGKDVRDNAYDPGRIYEERKALASAAAHAAMEHPFEVTDFGYRKLGARYDEALVPEYELPDPLVMGDGRKVSSAEQWYEERRPELVNLFETEMYGRAPGRPEDMHFKIVSCDDGVFAGTAVRKEINIYFTKGDDHYMTLLLYIPKHVKGPVPVVLGANFDGNASVVYDPGVALPDSARIVQYQLYKEPVRGAAQGRWPVGMILSRGYALATFFKGDLDPDWDDSFTNGVHGLFYREGQTYPEPDEWGSISAWAWGYSRALDYLETDPDVDASKVSTVGHSRLAKTALWAAVRDPRFAMAFPNNPGCAGGAISRRAYGESLEIIIRHYHYWFCRNFHKYAGHENDLPFDQHELIALMAPRPIYVASGEHDRWSDPKGEFISLVEASKVYEFLGLDGLGLEEMPGPWKPQHTGRIGYHMRSGPHEITAYDWSQFLDFADKYLKQPVCNSL